MALAQTWDLESIFPGGSASVKFEEFLSALEKDIASFGAQCEQLQNKYELESMLTLVQTSQNVGARQREAGAFVSCLNAADMTDGRAKLLAGRINQFSAALANSFTKFDALLLSLADDVWEALLSQPEFSEIRLPLMERRKRAQSKLDSTQETLISDLSVDGYHAWGDLYDTIVGRMTLDFEQNGKTKRLSMGQAANKMNSSDRQVRSDVFAKWEKTWEEQSELIASSLNHLGGHRLAVYKHRKWNSFLEEPLETNRMTEKTLTTMWDVITKNKGIFVEYLNRKAKLIGIDKLAWHDVSAPLGKSTASVSYDDASTFIVEQFHKFSPKMAEFAQTCFDRRWIEVENRPGKRPGGFCTSFPVSEQTRIFMTYSGSQSNVATLAHELGHAYHQFVMRGLPYMAQGYAMNVAETASTFAEMLVADAALKNASSKEETIVLLDDKIERAVAFFMNIHARFIFETNFYERRRVGLVPADELSKMMEEAQREAFQNSLASYHPHFWASKLHFYITRQPFYNFPYTFGYLFSNGLYARALTEGEAFAEKYTALLRDTGRLRVEDLAKQHLGVDLQHPEFWQSAVDVVAEDAKQFLALTQD